MLPPPMKLIFSFFMFFALIFAYIFFSWFDHAGTGLSFVASEIESGFSGELAEYVDAFAAGINAYIDEAKKGLDEGGIPIDIVIFQIVSRVVAGPLLIR